MSRTDLQKIVILGILSILIFGLNAQNDSIRVMSYNIRFANPNDGPDYWENRKKDMFQFIKAEAPDFVGIQEALWEQLQYLDEKLENYSFYGLGRDDGIKDGEVMAILFNNNKWKLNNPKTIWLSENPDTVSRGWDAACNRTATVGIFTNEVGEELALINTHFDHMGKEARTQSVQLINQLYSEYKDLYPTIVTGDFNLVPEDPLYDQFIMDDSFALTDNVIVEHEGTFNGFQKVGNFNRRIDYIFVDKTKTDVLDYEVPVPQTSNWRQLSDHFPVMVTLKIK